ncbi:MAG: mandelate racemase/muconate lactonizing enzyme family protein [Pseudomonadota bacterium]
MKISEINCFPVWLGRRNQLLVQVKTDDGLTGWGESGLSGREQSVIGAVAHYREFLLGQDANRIGRIWQEIYRSQYFEGGRVLTAAMSAIDVALHDIKGKSLGVPVYELLGGRQRDLVPGFATLRTTTPDEMLAEGKALIEAGWNCMRLPRAHHQPEDQIYDPRRSLADTAAWMADCREELGNAVVLGIDYHHRLSVAEAASFCQRMPKGTLDFIEEPIRDESPEAYATLRTLTDVPFAIGEEFASKWQFLPYIEQGLTQFARVDIANVGGFTEAMKVAGWSEAHYIDLMPHNPLGPITTAASVHLGAAVPNFAWLEVAADDGRNDRSIFPQQVKLEGANYVVPDTPGLGIEVNQEAVIEAASEFSFWEAPHLRRADGSVTNW